MRELHGKSRMTANPMRDPQGRTPGYVGSIVALSLGANAERQPCAVYGSTVSNPVREMAR